MGSVTVINWIERWSTFLLAQFTGRTWPADVNCKHPKAPSEEVGLCLVCVYCFQVRFCWYIRREVRSFVRSFRSFYSLTCFIHSFLHPFYSFIYFIHVCGRKFLCFYIQTPFHSLISLVLTTFNRIWYSSKFSWFVDRVSNLFYAF